MDKFSTDIIGEAYDLGFELYGIWKQAEMGDPEAQAYINEVMKQSANSAAGAAGKAGARRQKAIDGAKIEGGAVHMPNAPKDKQWSNEGSRYTKKSSYMPIGKPPRREPKLPDPKKGLKQRDPADTGDRVGKQSSVNYYYPGYVNPYFKEAGMAPPGMMASEAPMAAPEATIPCPQCANEVVPSPDGICPICGFDFNQVAVAPSPEELTDTAQQIKTAAISDPRTAQFLLNNYFNV